jgi:dipeptidyl aminopeptidase/acylaminoacyl peptidase
MRIASFVFAIFLAIPLASQTKHPFTFEDMMALKRVEEPVPSPDGKWVLFAAVDVDLKANTKTPHVWVVRISGGKEQEIISDQDADRPRWAPDGKRFAFVSTKENGSQIWIADFDGATGTVTTKHRVTDIATEADGELWSPDGKNILFKSDVYPECDGTPGAEAECNANKVAEAKNSKVKAQIFTHLLYRHWNAYKEGKRTHLFVQTLLPQDRIPPEGFADAIDKQGHPIPFPIPPLDLTPGDLDAPVFSLGGQDNYAFSPDGHEICYSSNHDREPAISTNNDLFTVPVDRPGETSPAQILAQTKNITADNKAADETPLYSPDGKYIAYRAQARPGYESDQWRLMLYDRRDGRKRSLMPSWFDKWTGDHSWAVPKCVHGSAEDCILGIYFSAEENGGTTTYELNFPPNPKKVNFDPKRPAVYSGIGPAPFENLNRLTQGYDGDLALSPDGRLLLFTRMSIERPAEIYEVRPPNFDFKNLPKGERVTHLNDSVLSQAAMSPLETFWFTGAHNDKVEGFLVKPPNFDPNKKYPVKFLIHGGPEGAWGDDWSYRWNPELFAANGYVVIMINFHGSTGYGQKFIDAINGDWGGAPFEDLMKGLDYAEEHYPFIDKTRECALGASYGGYMADWILGHTDRFKCIVTHDGMFNTESAWGDTEELWFNEWEFKGTPYTNRVMYRKWSPHLSATNFKTPTLVIHSQLDYRLDVSQGFDLFTTLQRQGVPSKMLYFPDEGHWILKPQNSQLWYKTVNDWVDQWVGKSVGSGQ